METSARASLFERALRVFTVVERGEGFVAVVMSVNVCVILTAYSIIKPVREGLILSMQSGAEYKSYMSGAIAIALLFAVPAYAKVADRLPKNRLVVAVTLFFASNLLLFYFAAVIPAVHSRLGLIFYLWVGVFNMMVVAQFWAFANDLYSEEQGRRLFPLIGLGQTLGAAVGSGVSVLLIRGLGTMPLMLVAAGLLGASAFLTALAYARAHGNRPAQEESGVQAPATKRVIPKGAFELVRKSRYLALIAGFSVVFTLVNSNGEFMLGKLFKAAANAAVAEGKLEPSAITDYLGQAYGKFYFAVNVMTLLLQGFAVSRIIRLLGVRRAFLIFPIVAMGDALLISFLPVLAVLSAGKVLENATDYSLNNTLRNMLWLRTTTDMKYKAKQAVDTFFVRMGDVSSALCVWLGAGVLALDVRAFAIANVVLISVWILLARQIGAEHDRLPPAEPQPAPAPSPVVHRTASAK
jgi:ATP:ADP antiporter, AAA family